jgi:DNA-binding NarL/FixJ family response regulator
MEKAVRILLANKPRLMRELLLATLSDQTWIEIVGEVTDPEQIDERITRTSPDLVVIDAKEPGRRPQICDALLRAHPELRIIAFAPRGDYAACYWVSQSIHSRNVEASEEGLLAAVRNLMEENAARGIGPTEAASS